MLLLSCLQIRLGTGEKARRVPARFSLSAFCLGHFVDG
ncbi:hypothetical protein B4098_0256 [Heyndrickxia coagulans]|uniref:Uncharacterized protein n=1 Tax=Heyndrickxia coagulans TaxID=1398 RepID=A0A150K6Y1_HEYCO|nr:hypothetical protein B4098_0256 [Heyndrickxia coagulans]